MAVRAPQYGRMPPGPNPAIAKGLRVAPFANIFALTETLGVISLHRTEAEANEALRSELERRRALRARAPASGSTPPTPDQ